MLLRFVASMEFRFKMAVELGRCLSRRRFSIGVVAVRFGRHVKSLQPMDRGARLTHFDDVLPGKLRADGLRRSPSVRVAKLHQKGTGLFAQRFD